VSNFNIDQMKAKLQTTQNSPKNSPSANSSLVMIKDTASFQEIIDKMSLPAVQARREKREAISYHRPTQNPGSRNRKSDNKDLSPEKRQEQR